jgi:streptogramin lyase
VLRATALLLFMGLAASTTQAQIVTEFSAGISPNASHWDITAGPDGNLWFTEINRDRIGQITLAGVVTEFSAGISPGAAPVGITAGLDGNLWFTEVGGNRIWRITAYPSTSVPTFSSPFIKFALSGPLLLVGLTLLRRRTH